MRTGRRPNLEKIIKSASDLLKIKEDSDVFFISPSSKADLMFVRANDRFLRPETSHKALNPRSRKEPKSCKNSQSPFGSSSNSSVSPSPQNDRAEKIHFMIDQLESLQKKKRKVKLPDLKVINTSNVTRTIIKQDPRMK